MHSEIQGERSQVYHVLITTKMFSLKSELCDSNSETAATATALKTTSLILVGLSKVVTYWLLKKNKFDLFKVN